MSKSKTPTSFFVPCQDQGSRLMTIILYSIMMKVAICLAAHANSGKSTSLKMLGHLLTGKECSECEIKQIFDYKGVKVGITSSGDTLDYLKPGFDELIAAECNFLVYACRTKGTAANYAYNKAKAMGYKIIRMGTAYDYSHSIQEICNKHIASAINETIDTIIELQ